MQIDKTNVVFLADQAKAIASSDLQKLKVELAEARAELCLASASVSEVQKLVDIQTLRMNVVFLSAICTGANPRKDRIIELGVVGENGGKLLSLRFNPEVPIPPSTAHSITDEDVAKLPLFETCSDALFELISKKKVVVHDLISDFLNAELYKTGILIQQVSGQAIISSSYFRPTPNVSALEQAQLLRKYYLAMLVA